ncbi:hypothetical protein ABK040_013709 [Willaertia magna]
MLSDIQLGSLFSSKQVYTDQKDYCQILLQCAITCEISYEKDPKQVLNTKYYNYNHNIKSLCSSITADLDRNATLETRYVIADCSDEKTKRLIVAIRGSYSKADVLTDVKLIPALNDYGYGIFHSGFLGRAKFIPIDYFFDKINEGYHIVFTGHSMGGAVAAILATRLLESCEVKAIKKASVQFIGFGVPLLADEKFLKRVKDNQQTNNYHFYVNEEDGVPRSISMVSEIIRLSSDTDLIDQVTKFLATVVTCISNFVGQKETKEMLLLGISVFQWFSKALAGIIHNFSPKYVPFGNHIHISYPYSNHVVKELQHDIYKVGLKETFSKEILDFIQHHKMSMYFGEVLKICDHFDFQYGKTVGLLNYIFGTTVSEIKDLHVPVAWNYVPPKWLHKQEEYKNAFEGKNCYSVRLIANDNSMDVRLTLVSKRFVDYITKVEIVYPECPHVSVHEEYGGITYCYTGATKYFMNRNSLTTKNISLKITSHFNSFNCEIPLNIVSPETGQSVKEEKISKLPVDLLYMYAISFLYATNQVHNSSIRNQRNTIHKLLSELDSLNEEDKIDPKVELNNDRLNSILNGMFFDNTNDKDESSKKLFPFDFIFSSKMAKLGDHSLSFNHIVQHKFVTILHHSAIQSTLINERFTEKLGMGISGVGASICAGLLFVPGINLLAIGGLIATGAVSVAGLAVFMAAYITKNRDKLNYEENLKTFMNSFGINYNHTVPTLYHFEKLILHWVSENDKKKVLRILQSICINCQLREELMKNLYMGVVGMKKSGKSTFTEKFLHVNANASCDIATTEIQVYPLTKSSDTFALLDYPHWESQDHLHKVQFITSRFLLDYVVVVYDALSKCDKEEIVEHFNIVKQSNHDNRVIVIMNKADLFSKEITNQNIFKNVKKECCSKLGVDESRLILASIDPMVDNIQELKSLGLNLMSDIRNMIWQDLVATCNNKITEIEQEWNSLKQYDALKINVIFRKKGKQSKLPFEWNEIKSMEFVALCERLKKEYDFNDVVITSKNSGDIITSMKQLLGHIEHEFEVEEKN